MSQQEAGKKLIIFVDHGGIKVLQRCFDIELTPDDIRDLAARRDTVYDAILFTDLHRLGWTDSAKEEAIRTWYNAGFTSVPCPRTGSLTEEKESIDEVLISHAYKPLGMIPSTHVHEWHLLFVVGDSDYRPIIIDALNRGFQTSVFLTSPCAILQLEQRLHEIYELYPKTEKTDPEAQEQRIDPVRSAQDVRTALRTLGRRARILNPTEAHQKLLDIVMGSIVHCARCGETIPLDRYAMHKCYPGRLWTFECSPPSHGPIEAGLLTLGCAERYAEWVSGRGAREVLPWYYWQAVRDVYPEQLSSILSLVDQLSWAIVDTALMLQACEDHFLSDSEITERFPLAQISVARDLELLVQADDRFHSITDTVPGFRPLIEEAVSRSQYPILSRLINPDYACPVEALREGLLLPERTRGVFIQGLHEAAEERLSGDAAHMKDLDWNETLLYLCQDIPVSSREERETIRRCAREETSNRIQETFGIIAHLLDQSGECDMLQKAEEILGLFPREKGFLRFMDILLYTGVLVHKDGRVTRGRPSHPAFQLLAYVREETLPNPQTAP